MKSYKSIIPFIVGTDTSFKSIGYVVAKDDIKGAEFRELIKYKYSMNPGSSFILSSLKPYIKIAVLTFDDKNDLFNLAKVAFGNTNQSMMFKIPDLSIFDGITIEHYNKSNVTEFHKFIKYYDPSILFSAIPFKCKNANVNILVDKGVKGYSSIHVEGNFVCFWRPSSFSLDNNEIEFEFENNVLYYRHFEKVYLLLDSKQRHKPYELGEQLNIDMRDGSAILYKNEVKNNMFYSNIYKFNKQTLTWHLVKTNQSFEVYATKRA